MRLRLLPSAVLLVGLLGRDAEAQQAPSALSASTLSPPRAFIENRGQWTNGALFQMRRGNSVVAVQRDGFTIQMLRIDRPPRDNRNRDGRDEPVTVAGWNLALRFRGASPAAVVQGVDELPGIYNWLRGIDPAGWVTRVPGFARVRITGLYPGIDLDLYERDGLLEYDLVLQPGADPSCIVVEVLGANSVVSDDSGRLMLRTPWQDVVHSEAICVVEGEATTADLPVDASYRRLSATAFAMDVLGWDAQRPLVIDPTVVYSTLLGGSNTEEPFGVAATDGRVFVCGDTFSIDFPTTPGALQPASAGSKDAYLTALIADGSALVYSTYLGGSFGDDANDVAICPDGSAVIAGSAGSSSGDFPVTAGAYDVTGNGASDGYVANLSADGSTLMFCTLLGGADSDPVSNVRVASDGTIYVAGLTRSSDFPTTPNAFAPTFSSIGDEAYVARFSADGSQLLASTLLGSTADTKGRGLGVDPAGNAYITGYASSNPNTPLPVTPGAFDTTPNGEVDAFVAKFSADLSSLVYCTYLGGSFFDEAWGLAVDSQGAAYVTGITDSSNFPTTSGALDPTKSGVQDAFVTKLDPTGSSLIFSTYLGGSGSEDADDIAVAAGGSVFIAGDTTSATTFPLTPDSWDATIGGDGDSYLVQLDPTGSTVTYSTYIGGNGGLIDECRTMCLDENGDAYVAGEAFSSDFPTTPGVFDPTMTDFKDSFVVRFAFGPWTVLGGALAGTGGIPPWLSAWGTLQPASVGEVTLIDALPNAPTALVVGLSQLAAPFKGGTLVPAPLVMVVLLASPAGQTLVTWTDWPSGIPAGTDVYFQAWVIDAGGPKGWAASQGLKATTP